MVMPKDNDKKVVFDLSDMKNAVRRISLMADERNRSIRVTVREGEVEVTAQSSEEGEGAEVVPADYTGEEVMLGFNHQYLQEFLNNVGALESASVSDAAEEGGSNGEGAATARAKDTGTPTRISFEFKDSNAATQIRIDGETAYDYKYIVMPLRI